MRSAPQTVWPSRAYRRGRMLRVVVVVDGPTDIPATRRWERSIPVGGEARGLPTELGCLPAEGSLLSVPATP